MTKTRSIALLGAVQFVQKTYGQAAHERVLAALSEDVRRGFVPPIRDSNWRPLTDLGAYTETAKALLAPKEPDFFHRLGRFIGHVERERGGFKPMVAEPATTMRMMSLVWRAIYDEGRAEVAIAGPKEGFFRIHDFLKSRTVCQTHAGAMEGLFGTDKAPVRVEETACVHDGSPYCEFHVLWE
jgi:hypothetical protein